jgi:hypothetical protein
MMHSGSAVQIIFDIGIIFVAFCSAINTLEQQIQGYYSGTFNVTWTE